MIRFCDKGRMTESPFDVDLVLAKMQEQKVSQSAIAKLAGLPSQSAFSNIVKGKRRITAVEAATIYRFLGIQNASQPDVHFVPIIGLTSAGRWREAVEMRTGSMGIPHGKSGKLSFAVQVDGDSMDEVFPNGSYVIIDPDQKELAPGKCYLIQNGDHEVTVKCYRRDPARFVPLSSNPIHQPFLVSDHDFLVLGRVTWKGGPV